MRFNFEVQAVVGVPGPDRALKFQVRGRWYGAPGVVLGLDGQLSLGPTVLSRSMSIADSWPAASSYGQPETKEGEERALFLSFSLSDAAIRAVEVQRGRHGDVPFGILLMYRWHEVQFIAAPGPTPRTVKVAGDTHWEQAQVGCMQPQSEWMKRLKELKWEEYELIEMPKQPLAEDRELAQALSLVAEAQTALRSGDYKGTVGKCRNAFESAAKYKAQGKVAEGFALLIEQAWPNDKQKREPFDALIRGLSEVTQTIGRHEQYPAVSVSRSEAECVFTMTIALFSMLSRRHTGMEAL